MSKPTKKKLIDSWNWLHDAIQARPTKSRNLSPTEFAETTKVTAGPRKGSPFSLRNSPHITRPLELIDPKSPVTDIRCMFPAQTSKSVFAQLTLAYYAKEVPSEIIYVAPNIVMGRKVMTRRIEPTLRSIGVEFRTATDHARTKRTGDLTLSKEFDGGNIDVATANSAADLSQETKRIGIFDETDRAKVALGDEGSPWSMFYARMQAWDKRKKAIGISTPKDWDSSLIFSLFNEGTQEEYFVPCYRCGHLQVLKIKKRSGYGLDWKTRNDKIIESSIVYVCESCGDSFKEIHKFDIIQTGKNGDAIWRQQAEPLTPYIASFHISALNSMFKSWYELANEYIASVEDPSKRKEFENLQMGLPYKEVGNRPKWENVVHLKGKYKSGDVPMGVLFLVIGVDVQRGAEKYKNMSDLELDKAIKSAGSEIEEKNFPRIEFEVMGSGPGYRTWSIMYKRLLGRVDDPYSGAWELFSDWAEENRNEHGRFGFSRHDGEFFAIKKTFIDSGDGDSNDIVYQFTQQWHSCYPIKGVNAIKQRKGEKGDELTADNFMRYRKTKLHGDIILHSISTNFYKSRLYAQLKINRIEEDPQKSGFCDFPRDRSNDYFKMLTAEERRADGSYHAGGRRNESMDVRNYAQCAADVYIDELVEEKKASMKKEGHLKKDIMRINPKYIIDYLAIKKKIPEAYYKKA